VLRAALALADKRGVESLTMRRLGQELGVEAMSLYSHVESKDEILDGIVDLVVSEIELPSRGCHWKVAMRRRAISAHEVLLRHPWAPTLMESRENFSPARLRYADSVIRALREAGFSIELAYHAFLTLDSYLYGFTLQEVSWPFGTEELPNAVERPRHQLPIDHFPFVREMMGYVLGSGANAAPRGKGTSAYAPEFEFGLDLILEALERAKGCGGSGPLSEQGAGAGAKAKRRPPGSLRRRGERRRARMESPTRQTPGKSRR
jgi:AcrR family transcriptional regulator